MTDLVLVWSDEFTGTSLDLTKWESAGTYFNYGEGSGQELSGINNMSQCEVSGGKLKMHAVKGSFPAPGHTPDPATWKTAAIQAKFGSGFKMRYGQRLEVACSVPAVSGIRPAVWIVNRGGYAGYIADDSDGEVDLVEQYFNTAYGGGERNQSAVIWSYSPFKQNNDEEHGAGLASGPHTYALEWDDTIRIYRDGALTKEYTTWASAHGAGGPPTFPRPLHDGAEYWVMVTFQIGGKYSAHSFTGADNSQYIQPVDPAVSAVTWEIDYIRVYDMVESGGAPTANNDTATVAQNAAATAIPVLANDAGTPLSISAVTQPPNGTVVITGGGTGLTYQPDTGYCSASPDTFTYTLASGGSTATVNVYVPCPAGPDANDDYATVAQDSGPSLISVLANDTGTPLSIASVTQPANGTVVIVGGSGGGEVSGTPATIVIPGPTANGTAASIVVPGPGTDTSWHTADRFEWRYESSSDRTQVSFSALVDLYFLYIDGVEQYGQMPGGGHTSGYSTATLSAGTHTAHAVYGTDTAHHVEDGFEWWYDSRRGYFRINLVSDDPDVLACEDDTGYRRVLVTGVENFMSLDDGTRSLWAVREGGGGGTGVTYEPDPGYSDDLVADTFTYTLTGGSTATVFVTVAAPFVPSGPVVGRPGYVGTAELIEQRSGQRFDRFDFELLDQAGNRIGRLTPTTESVPTITASTERTVMRELSGLEFVGTERTDVDIRTDRLRPVCIMANGERFPLGVYLFGEYQHEPWSPHCMDQGHLLDQQIDRSLSLDIGKPTQQAITMLVEEVGIFRYEIEAPPMASSEPISWAAGTTRAKILTDIAALMACHRPFFDNDGVLHFRPVPEPDTIQPDHVYGAGRIIASSTLVSDDSFRAPNRYLVIGTSAQSPIVGTYDVPGEAPHSIANRGYIVAETVDAPGVTDTDSAKRAALAAYLADSRAWMRLSFESTLDPRHDLFDVIRYEGAPGTSGLYLETGFRQQLRYDGSHTHDAARLWEKR